VSAQIIQFPRRERGAIRVERVEGGDWHVIYDGQGWPHSSREAALREANAIAAQVNATMKPVPTSKSAPVADDFNDDFDSTATRGEFPNG